MIEFVFPSFLSSFTTQILDVFLDLDENNTTFTLHSLSLNNQSYSLIVETNHSGPSKFYFSDVSIIVINKSDNFLIGGTKDGAIVLWDLRVPDSFYRSEKSPFLNESLQSKFPNEVILRTPNCSSMQELMINPSSFAHKAAISKIFVNPENSINKEIITLDIVNQLIIWKIMELSTTEIDRNFINFGSRSKIKFVQSLQINLSDIFAESLKDHLRIFNIHNFDIDLKENLLYFCSNSKIVKSDKYGSVLSSPPNVYSLKESLEEACPMSIFITNAEIFYVGYSDGGIGLVIFFFFFFYNNNYLFILFLFIYFYLNQ